MEVFYLDVPTVEDWHSQFSRIDCDPKLSKFLVFDAGGYSLDIYGAFSSASKPISESFPAGSTRINRALVEELRKANPERSEQDHADKAEEIKINVCGNAAQATQHEFYDLCRSQTRSIYEVPLRQILRSVREKIKGAGFPILLTGGGSRNEFLMELIEEILSENQLLTVPINSPLLYCTMHKAGGRFSPELKLFQCMASAFHSDEEMPRLAPAIDILGGLTQHASQTPHS